MSKFSVTYSSIGVRGRFSWPSKRFKCFVREASTKTSTKTGEKGKKGLVIGVYTDENGRYSLTKFGSSFNSTVNGKIMELIEGSKIKLGKCLVFNGLDEFYGVAVSGLGKQDIPDDDYEFLNRCKENIRIASSVGSKALQNQTVENIVVDQMSNAEAAAEGAILGLWTFQEFRNNEDREIEPKVHLYDASNADSGSWINGVVKAQAQNIARRLADLPSNILTPYKFAEATMDYLCPCGITVVIRDRYWIEKQRMYAFLTMAQGSCEPPYFVEMAYCGGSPDDKPIVLAGMGLTFDSGGLCLKPCDGMPEFRGNCVGAAVVVGVMKAIAQYKLPINVIGLLPLMENMIGGLAVKPGDIVLAKNERTIRVEDPNNAGRVVMADTVVYADQFKPCLVNSIGSFTLGIRKCLGSSSTPVYTTSQEMWDEMKKAGTDTGDRVWRFPLWEHYNHRNTLYPGVDYHNVGYQGHSRGGDSALAAAFVRAFAPKNADFVHMDITGTALITSGKTTPYYRRGYMTGRPTRTIIQFLKQLANPGSKPSTC
ncbi:cytosol aminopeptidase-like [Rhodnius prolixus]|uniref:cytosol aminopeptidase-like n=1 Tax=Rhodnius prolixus TaxID=13249 RepID=UPI003D18C77F